MLPRLVVDDVKSSRSMLEAAGKRQEELVRHSAVWHVCALRL